MMASNINMFTS